ncbi:MAG: hypothetical protein GWN30_38390 [Gammaproteobacteria bacterium]|nr:hypothetical protein [Gammaproteobacteria bacterium]
MEEIPQLRNNRNELTHAKHRKESFWQIIFPFSLGFLIILGLAAWVIVSAATGVSVRPAADTSAIFMIIPTMIVALIFLVISAAVAYGVIWLNRNLPVLTKRIQDVFTQVQNTVRQISDKTTAPVIQAEGLLAGLQTFFRSAARPFKRKQSIGRE